MAIKTYSELKNLVTFEDRFDYLKLVGVVGSSTFGFDRYMNQMFYTSSIWKRVRDAVIIRDKGCDLGIEDRQIFDRITVHHMNPISIEDFEEHSRKMLDPNFLICTSRMTHQAIHFGDVSLLPKPFVKRKPGDTNLW